MRSQGAALVVAVACVACSSSKPASPASISARALNIVAAESFWGSIVAQLAGRAANVTSVVSAPNADPHTYESTSDDARAFARADYAVVNGAGYDAWAGKVLSGNPNPKRRVLVIADLLGKTERDNPHFWYAPDYVTEVTDRVEADLEGLDPADAALFRAQRAALDAAMAPYRARLSEIRQRFAGVPVASTESIFAYLAQYLGLDLVSPTEFMRAVAEGNDPPAGSVARFHDQISKKQAAVLVYNKQTSTAVTTNIKKLAAHAGIPTVGVTETVQPSGATFERWFEDELVQLEQALEASGRAP